MKEFDKIISFINFLNKFRNVLRIQTVPGQSRKENDMEHSYLLTMYAWYICTIYKIDLNLEKVLKYCLIHDLVEVYAGDTSFFANKKEMESKKQREYDAFIKIKKEFIEFPEIAELIEDYENKKDDEAKLVYSLDKNIDVLEIYIERGKTWKELVPSATFERHLKLKRDKIKEAFPAKEINEEIHKRILSEGISNFFNNT